MVDYQKMYCLVCRAASRAIDAPTEKAKQILLEALYEAEDLYIRACEEDAPQKDARPTP